MMRFKRYQNDRLGLPAGMPEVLGLLASTLLRPSAVSAVAERESERERELITIVAHNSFHINSPDAVSSPYPRVNGNFNLRLRLIS